MLLTRLFRSNLRTSLKYLYSEHSPYFGLSDNAQRCILATSIIREILSAKPPQNFGDLSLREKIIGLKPKLNEKVLVSDEAQKQIKDLFINGIYLNSNVFSQSRIQLGEQPLKQDEKLNKFIFCPNYLTTRQIFKILVHTSEDRKVIEQDILLTGGYGISKTVSIILYLHLSKYIHSFYLTAQEYFVERDQLKFLTENKLIDLVPKCWYWSIKPSHHSPSEFNIQDLILEQATQLSLDKRKKLQRQSSKIFEFAKYLKKFYPNIFLKAVVDQINVLASIARKYNIYQNRKELGQLLDSEKTPVDEQKQAFRRQIFTSLEYQLQLYRRCGNHCILNSSVHIEKDLLRSSEQKLTLDIYGHETPNEIQISYQDLLRNKNWAKVDYLQYFWFEIYRSLIKQEINQELPISLNQIKSIFIDQCKQRGEIRSYFRFLEVRQFLNQSPTFSSISLKKTKTQVEQWLAQIVQKFNNFSSNRLIQHLQNFIQKGEENARNRKKAYLQQLYQYALKLCSQQKQSKVQKSKFQDYILFWLGPDGINSIEYKLDQQYLKLKYEQIQTEPHTLRIMLTPYEIIQVLTVILYPKIAEYIPMGKDFRKFIDLHQQARGLLLEFYFLQSLNAETQFLIKLQGVQKKQLQRSGLIDLTFNIASKQQFLSFSDNQEEEKEAQSKNTQSKQEQNMHSIEKNFQEMFEIGIRTPSNYYVGIPYKLKNGRLVFDSYHPSFDFSIIQYNQVQKKHILSTFDITTSRNSQSILKKRNDAQNLLQKLLKESKNEIQVNHYILCRNNTITTQSSIEERYKRIEQKIILSQKQGKEQKQRRIEDQRLSIYYVDLEKVVLKNKNQQISKNISIFYKTLRLLKNLEAIEERRAKSIKRRIAQQK